MAPLRPGYTPDEDDEDNLDHDHELVPAVDVRSWDPSRPTPYDNDAT